MQAEQAERARVEAEQRAEREKKEASERAEREKQAAIDAEKRRAQEEADRILREAEAKEAARIAEQQRIAAEEAARAADVKHRKIVGTEIVTALLAHTSLSREQAIEVLTALKDGLVPRANINY
jgi:membrane protein involved in colicin uptake